MEVFQCSKKSVNVIRLQKHKKNFTENLKTVWKYCIKFWNGARCYISELETNQYFTTNCIGDNRCRRSKIDEENNRTNKKVDEETQII